MDRRGFLKSLVALPAVAMGVWEVKPPATLPPEGYLGKDWGPGSSMVLKSDGTWWRVYSGYETLDIRPEDIY